MKNGIAGKMASLEFQHCDVFIILIIFIILILETLILQIIADNPAIPKWIVSEKYKYHCSIVFTV